MHRRFYLLIALSLTLILGDAASARASQMVWSGLVIANNVAQPDEIPPELNRLEGTLKAWFGYNQFKVIGQSRDAHDRLGDGWLEQILFPARNSRGRRPRVFSHLNVQGKVLLELKQSR